VTTLTAGGSGARGRGKVGRGLVALLVALALFAAACGGDDGDDSASTSTSEQAADTDPNGKIRVAYDLIATMRGGKFTLDPAATNTPLTDDALFYLLYGRLMRPSPDGGLVPDLAERATVVDQNTIEVKLRRGLTFSDGTPFDADVVKAGLDRSLESGNSVGLAAAFYDLDSGAHNDYVLAELAQRVEAVELGITCGFADRYVPLFGGVAYLDYRDKLQQRDLGAEPFVTYERLDNWVADLPLVVVSSGVARDSGDVHARMRPRYLQEHEAWQARLLARTRGHMEMFALHDFDADGVPELYSACYRKQEPLEVFRFAKGDGGSRCCGRSVWVRRAAATASPSGT